MHKDNTQMKFWRHYFSGSVTAVSGLPRYCYLLTPYFSSFRVHHGPMGCLLKMQVPRTLTPESRSKSQVGSGILKFFWLCHMACRILVPQLGVELRLWQ